jgi:hypothetical protein
MVTTRDESGLSVDGFERGGGVGDITIVEMPFCSMGGDGVGDGVEGGGVEHRGSRRQQRSKG